MFGLGTWEIFVILLVALLVLGPDRLPKLARTLGKGLREVRRASNELRMNIELDDVPPRPSHIQHDGTNDSVEVDTTRGAALDPYVQDALATKPPLTESSSTATGRSTRVEDAPKELTAEDETDSVADNDTKGRSV